jgi:hypothetical protein
MYNLIKPPPDFPNTQATFDDIRAQAETVPLMASLYFDTAIPHLGSKGASTAPARLPPSRAPPQAGLFA